MYAHPLTIPNPSLVLQEAIRAYRKPLHEQSGMDGFLDDVFDSAWDAVTGLSDAISGAITATINTIKQLGETIALVVRACVGDVEWKEVLNSAGKVFQNVGAVVYYLNPTRIGYEWIKQAPLTAHAFNELDKFTGGMITTAVNISDLPARAMRGDPISKQELLKDAMLIIQVCAIVFTGGGYLAVGVMVGTMVGRQVCSKQTEAKDACMAAFMIAGAAIGSWGDSITASSATEMTQAEMNAWLAGDQAYAAFLDQSITGHLTAGAQTFLQQQGIDLVTEGAVRMCQSGDWVGNRECELLGQVVNNYLKTPGEVEWSEFLATEVARIGAQELMLQWFPEQSKEARAIKRTWNIQYIDGEVLPGSNTVVQQSGINPKILLAAAGAAALVIFGGAV